SSLPYYIVDISSSVSMQGAVASATNRLLAVELYLKAFLVGAGVSVPFEHDLKLLFDLLSKENRETIKFHFDDRSKPHTAEGVAWSVTMLFQLGSDFDVRPFRQKPDTARIDPSLSALLVRNRHGFVVSRYLFQEAKFDKVSTYNYEHRALAILCGILCEGLESSLPDRSPIYQRTHQF
ncbi:MAG: hypothetical protein JWR52_3859, partial [Marmoricola sp.]|nr:hypothetical protein [Marmoricola sp.]